MSPTPPGVPKGPEGATFFKLKTKLNTVYGLLLTTGSTHDGPWNSLQYGCLLTCFDHGVWARWTLTVSGLPRTHLRIWGPWRSQGCFVFLSSNPYNMGVYWLLLTCWGPPEVPEGPKGTSSLKLKPPQYGCLRIPFDLRVDGKNLSQIYWKKFFCRMPPSMTLFTKDKHFCYISIFTKYRIKKFNNKSC